MKNAFGIKLEDIKVGAVVEFKFDIEQAAKVVAVSKSRWGGLDVTVENEHGFDGEYAMTGQTTLKLHSDDVFYIL